MLANFERHGPLKHYLSSEQAKAGERSQAVADIMQSTKAHHYVPEILLRWLIDSGASKHVLPQDYVKKNSGQFMGRAEKFCGHAARGLGMGESCATKGKGGIRHHERLPSHLVVGKASS